MLVDILPVPTGPSSRSVLIDLKLLDSIERLDSAPPPPTRLRDMVPAAVAAAAAAIAAVAVTELVLLMSKSLVLAYRSSDADMLLIDS